jgi:hypothetical protein
MLPAAEQGGNRAAGFTRDRILSAGGCFLALCMEE